MTILLTEDEPSIRGLIEEWLRRSDYNVLLASNAREAIDLANSYRDAIDMVVTDFSMPGLSGIELVREIRKSRPAIHAIVISGHWIHPLPTDVRIEFLSKPCSAAALLAAIKRAA